MNETLTIWLAGLGLLWLPGVALLRGLRGLGLRPFPDAMHRTGIEIGLGLALWPVLFLWTSALGLAWTPLAGRLTVLLLAGTGLAILVRRERLGWRRARVGRRALEILAWIGLIALTVRTRLAQIAELPLPNWVDSVHHAMILRIFVEKGALPATFAPILPDNLFLYHWGYHANAAWLAWLLGWSDPFQLAQMMLHFGQLLNSLTLVMVYMAGRTLFHSRRAGMLAAALAVLVSWYPAFYVSWGRYTQISGLLILAPFMVQVWGLHRSRQMRLGELLAVALLGAGLVLIHVRVAFFALTLGAILVGAVVLEERWGSLRRWSLAGLGVAGLSGPWLWRLLSSQWIQFHYTSPPPADPNPAHVGYNLIQWGLVWAPRNQELIALATGGISGLLGWGERYPGLAVAGGLWLALLLGLAGWSVYRRQGRSLARLGGALLILGSWVGVTAILLNLEAFGLPALRISNNNAGVIALFVPLCLAGGGLLAWALGQLTPVRWSLAVTALTAVGLGAWGSWGMASVVNPVTTLARPADVAALAWVREHTPADALFAVRPWLWLGDIYAGVDGGYWLPVLTDRRSVLPPALYNTGIDQATFDATNELLAALAQATDLDDPDLRARLAAAGVTHLYIGPREGNGFQVERLRNSPHARLIYAADGVAIFEFLP